jgi:hypothetical protein
MAQTLNYSQSIRTVLKEIAQTQLIGDIRFLTVFDDEHQTYQINAVGWENNKPLCYIVVLLEIRNNKIWLLEDSTDYGVTDALEQLGISKSEIVLGFVPPAMRADTGYAVA